MQDRRTFNLLMTNAWSRITLNVEHSIKKSDLRGEHRSNERLSDTIDRLMKTLVVITVVRDGKPSDLKVQLLGPTVENRDDSGNLYYRFLPELIEIISRSDHWARLQAQVMLALTSKYSQNLYEMIQRRSGLSSKFSEEFSIPEIRDVLGVADGKMTRWPDLRRFCIEPAVAEVAELSSCYVRVEPIKHKRLVIGVKMTWFQKNDEDQKTTYQVIEQHKIKRRSEKK
jgi:plasmid replication initiation protein